MRRYFRVKATGQWLAAYYEDAHFPESGEAMANRLVPLYRGLDVGEIEAVDVDPQSADDDPREGALLEEERRGPPPAPPEPSPLDALLDALADASNFADMKAKAAEIREKRRNPPQPPVPVGPDAGTGRHDPGSRVRPE